MMKQVSYASRLRSLLHFCSWTCRSFFAQARSTHLDGTPWIGAPGSGPAVLAGLIMMLYASSLVMACVCQPVNSGDKIVRLTLANGPPRADV